MLLAYKFAACVVYPDWQMFPIEYLDQAQSPGSTDDLLAGL